ncbi:MAG TPA: TetR/AcrR family transcriptional regulator [Thermoleophilaceae bacterium]|jgi:AcrR family transcriptional regulator|nr:TetR/AcrR family transcriptional regulator [Thermoleophilaceae bacterium]
MESAAVTADTPGRREELKAQNRAKLLAAGRKVFAEKGVGAATARDIVRETDLATGTFYNYFEDKDEVFRALISEHAEKARRIARAERRKAGNTVEQRVHGAYRGYFELVLEEREMFEVIRRNAGAISVVTDTDVFEPAIRELVEDLAEWAEAGDLPQVDLDYLGTAMAAVAFQVAIHLVERDPADPDAAATFCTKVFLGGIPALAG